MILLHKVQLIAGLFALELKLLHFDLPFVKLHNLGVAAIFGLF